jgi:hypothetical protein
MANPRKPDQKSSYEPDYEPDDEPDYEPDYEQECSDDDDRPDSPYGCEDLPEGPEPPKLGKPKKCKPRCNCPTPPPSTKTCFDQMIAKQDNIANRAEQAKRIKASLEEMKTKATTAKQTYTRQKYDDFKKRWKKLDKDIINAIDTVTCNIKCWWCVIECHMCPLLYRVRWIEERLYGDGTLMSDVHSLTDLEYWHTRNVAAKQQVFDRIELVLNAWGDPATSIEAALAANEQAVGTIRSLDPLEALRKVLFEMVPLHIAIAPRDKNSPRNIPTNIDGKYLKLCGDCDPELDPDDCCGPDVSLPSARQRLTKPQAFIVDPDQLIDILCCLVTQRYEPAKKQLEHAQEILGAITADITALNGELATLQADPLATFKQNIATPINCDKYTKKNGGNGNGDGGGGDCAGDDDEGSDEESAS